MLFGPSDCPPPPRGGITKGGVRQQELGFTEMLHESSQGSVSASTTVLGWDCDSSRPSTDCPDRSLWVHVVVEGHKVWWQKGQGTQDVHGCNGREMIEAITIHEIFNRSAGRCKAPNPWDLGHPPQGNSAAGLHGAILSRFPRGLVCSLLFALFCVCVCVCMCILFLNMLCLVSWPTDEEIHTQTSRRACLFVDNRRLLQKGA